MCKGVGTRSEKCRRPKSFTTREAGRGKGTDGPHVFAPHRPAITQLANFCVAYEAHLYMAHTQCCS